MKKLKLPENKFVVFNPAEHTYTTQMGVELSGITSIISKYLFPDKYANVSEGILEAARERGHAVHKELEELFNKTPLRLLVQPETHAYISLAAEHNLKQVAAEYLVSDDEHIATCIDSVLQTKGGAALVDYKTTAVLDIEYLQWQLSIEAYMFEKQTDIKVTDLYAIHLPKPIDGVCNGKLVYIKRLPDEYVEGLLTAYIEGAETFVNPMRQMSVDTNDLIEQYMQAEEALVELTASVDYYKSIQAEIKNALKERMDAQGTTKLENDKATITRTKDSVRKTFKLDKMREIASEQVNSWLDSNIDKCYTETTINGNITIKFK